MDAPDHRWRRDPFEHRDARIFSDFELTWPVGLALYDRHARADGAADDEVRHFETNEVAAAELTVDRQIEQREIA